VVWKAQGTPVQWACHFAMVRRNGMKGVVSRMFATGCANFLRQSGAPLV
jgi:hypothetical protein